jgi:hypothetical protein
MPLNMELFFTGSNVAAVGGAWPVMGFTSHQQVHGGPSGRSARTTPPSHTPEVPPKWASRSTWFGWVFTENADLSFCVLVTNSPRRAKLGRRAPRDALGQHPSADPRRWRPAGGPVAGAGLAVCSPAASGI